MRFRISSEASGDLVSVWEYTKDRWGIEQADLYIDGFMLRFVWLIENGALWSPGPDIKPGVFSCIEKSHVIFFSEGQGHINILRILHGRMDSGRHLE
ncbi:type II toxin-antitoxin system RelE/ParE family toxin [Pseudomonadota bacterium]|jgi:toxin ParE1/3/4|nr:type II toxin-antitoxin system RelE/ParE family toxin [Xanthomonadales bacterium]